MKKWTIVLAIIAVVAIALTVVFAVQKGDLQKQVNDMTAQVNDLTAQVNDLTAQVGSLNEELTAAKAAAETASKTAEEEAAAAAAAKEEAAKAAEEAAKAAEEAAAAKAAAELAARPNYTYNVGIADFPTNWSAHQNQTATDSDLMEWIQSAFFYFDYNEAKDGYVIKPLVVKDFPVDVTAEYVGEKWGIKEGDTTRAWKFTLRDDLKWEDGTPIKASNYVNSAMLSLNPVAQNHRADSLYSGNMVVTNAEKYAKQGVASDTALGAYMEILGAADVEALIAAIGDQPGFINWNTSFGDTYDFAASAWTGAAEDAVVDSSLTVKDLYEFYTTGEGRKYATWASDEQMLAWALDELFAKYTAPEMAWENVGVLATDTEGADLDLVLILEKPLEGFYLYYSLTDNFLVKEDLYHQCESVTDGVYYNSYGTSVETTASFGPYKLTEFQSDRIYTLEKNDQWFGYNDADKANWYQTTKFQVERVEEPATRLEMFLNGQLDTFGLSRDYIEEYGASDYTYHTEGDSVFAMVFNPDLAALTANQAAAGENINKTIITIKEFRMAMSLGMDRANFCEATSPMNQPAFALYGGQIVADPDGGIFYRATDEAKQVVANFWGLTEDIGEGKLYATIDDAIDGLSGFNEAMAKEYFNLAYDKAIEAGLMDDDDVIEIMVGTPNATSTFYNNGYDFIVNNYTNIVVGTKLEGKITFKRDSTLGNNFSNALRNSQVDMLFGVGWTGSTFDPYGLMEAYTTENYQYDPAWDTSTATLDITLDGVTYTATVLDWTFAMSGTAVKGTNKDTGETVELAFPYSTDPVEAKKRIDVLAAMENCVLQNYDFIPLMGDSGANLKGMQISYYTEDEIFPMGRGGLRYMTYNYTDEEWNAYVVAQGGTLNYK